MDKDMLQAFREMLKEELDPIRSDIKELKVDVLAIKEGQDSLKLQFEELKKGQEEIKTMVGELDPKNAHRHLELQNSISELKKDLSTVEIVTASNYSDLAKLKSAK